jgi:hypothetical protein
VWLRRGVWNLGADYVQPRVDDEDGSMV